MNERDLFIAALPIEDPAERCAYLDRICGDDELRKRVEALPKRDPIEVARRIASVAQDPNPKLRYLVGRDAKMQLALKRVLPWKWHEKVVANFLKID